MPDLAQIIEKTPNMPKVPFLLKTLTWEKKPSQPLSSTERGLSSSFFIRIIVRKFRSLYGPPLGPPLSGKTVNVSDVQFLEFRSFCRAHCIDYKTDFSTPRRSSSRTSTWRQSLKSLSASRLNNFTLLSLTGTTTTLSASPFSQFAKFKRRY